MPSEGDGIEIVGRVTCGRLKTPSTPPCFFGWVGVALAGDVPDLAPGGVGGREATAPISEFLDLALGHASRRFAGTLPRGVTATPTVGRRAVREPRTRIGLILYVPGGSRRRPSFPVNRTWFWPRWPLNAKRPTVPQSGVGPCTRNTTRAGAESQNVITVAFRRPRPRTVRALEAWKRVSRTGEA
jgi:hypothetical protein